MNTTHHFPMMLTTDSLANSESEHVAIDTQVDAFLKAGGEIKKVSRGATGGRYGAVIRKQKIEVVREALSRTWKL